MSFPVQSNFSVATPIYYVNDVPHIGHAYCTIAADVLARYHRQLGDNVLFSTGTDEHGQKIEKTALANQITPQQLVDQVAPRFQKLWDQLNISYDDFVRTTEPRHEKVVQDFFRKVYEKGDITLGHYEGSYCRPCETYWTEANVTDNACPECGRQLEVLKEESFFFKLSTYADRLLDHIDKNPNFILPKNRRNEVINLIKQGLPDLSISRVTCQWGIPVPPEINKTLSTKPHFIYVWFDSLLNYLTVAGGLSSQTIWPTTVNLVGKDIVKFHAITWPIMLMAADLPLPTTVFGHGFLTVDGEKISKSMGNAMAIEPFIDKYGVDTLRYFLLREISFGQDGTVSEAAVTNRYNADLANNLGNLLSRTLTMTEKYCEGFVPIPNNGSNAETAKLIKLGKNLTQEIEKHLAILDFTKALETIWDLITQANRTIEETAPWKLAKEGQNELVNEVLYTLLETIRLVAIVLKPFIPDTAGQILFQLGCPVEDNDTNWGGITVGQKIDKGGSLFQRIADGG